MKSFRKSNKTISLILTIAMVLSLFSGIAIATEPQTRRIAGADRFATSVAVANAKFASASTVIVTRGDVYADGLAASVLSKALNAPILLTQQSALPASVKTAITNFGATKVIVLGGEAAVSAAVATELTAMGVTVERVAGANRFETAVAVATKAKAAGAIANYAFIVNGHASADSLVAGAAAFNAKAPILQVAKDSVPATTKAAFAALGITKVYIVGGTAVISEAVAAELATVVTVDSRIAGATRFATAVEFAKAMFTNSTDFTAVRGTDANLADAIGAAVLGNPVLYVEQAAVPAAVKAFIESIFGANFTIIGGTVAVNAAVETALQALAPVGVKVVSASAINATQVRVVFSQAVEETDAETLTKYSIGGSTPVSAVLQADKKSVVLTMAAAITGTNLYIINPIVSVLNATVKTAIFTAVETYTDTTAPTVRNIEYPTFSQAKVIFSEPMQSLGTITISQEGLSILNHVSHPFSAGASEVVFDLSHANVVENKPITVVFAGAHDRAGQLSPVDLNKANLINPNPTTVTLTKSKTDIVKPTVVSVTALSTTRVEVTFSEKLSALPAVTVGGNNVAFPVYDAANPNVTFTGTFTAATGVQVVSVVSFNDMSGNAGVAPVTFLRQFVADTTAPVLQSAVVKTFNNQLYLVLTYNEDVVPGSGTLSGIRIRDFISHPFTAVGPTLAHTKALGADVDNAKAVMVNITNDTNFPVGNYTLTAPAGFVLDLAALQSPAVAVSFTKGALSVVDTTAPVVNTVTLSSDFMTVTFNKNMNPATALNVNNYRVGGATIFSAAIFDANAQTVRLTVIPGTITISALRQVAISGARDASGNTMTAYAVNMMVFENVKPFVASAKFTNSTTVEVTMSESVTGIDAASFEFYVNGVKATGTLLVAGTANVYTVTLAAPITDLTKNYQIRLVDADVVDGAMNKAVTGTLVKVSN